MAEKTNPMKEIKIEKVTINSGIGEPGERLESAKTILERLTGKNPCFRKTMKRTTFGVAKGRNIGVVVTLRGDTTKEMLARLIKAKEGKLKSKSFSGRTFSFGIPEYLDIPKMEYDPKIGIMGMDICVTLRRAGIKKGKKVGKSHQISSDEARDFVSKNFGVKFL
ncbi:MAG: 50S ribosomal protein L5 [Candidatus Aenigmarchaeota archaeon]|nr:50S ribosomal protein L5 [Candidatus Aenigmarchaeota archaeon]